MGAVMDRLLGRRTEARTLTRENSQPVAPLMLSGPTVAGTPISERTALALVDVLACVRAIAEAAACLPLHAYRRLPEGRERLVGGRLVSLLHRPAPGVTQSAFVGAAVQSLACRGNVFIGLYSDESGQVAQLGVIPPDRVQVEIRGGEPRYTLTHDSGKQTQHTTEDVLHVRLPVVAEDGILGLNPIQAAREALGLNRALSEESSALVANNSAPLGVLSVASSPVEDDVLENLRAGMEARHRGALNRGRVAVLSSAVTFSPISISPHDMELVEQRRLSTAEILRLFRVPGFIAGAQTTDSLTYSTVEGQQRAFQTMCLNPYLVALEQGVSGHERLCSERVYVEFERAASLEADTATQADVFAQALHPEQGWMTRSEVRARLNLPPERAREEAA